MLDIIERTKHTARIVNLDEARSRLRAPAAAGARSDACRHEHSPADIDDELLMYPLVDAILMLFHLEAGSRGRFASANLRDAIRRAVASQPMTEAVEIRASTWKVIQDIGFIDARLASQRRFMARYGDGELP